MQKRFSAKKLGVFILSCALLYTGAFTLLDQYGQKPPMKQTYDAIIVLGCRVDANGQPSLALQGRTKLAVQLFEQGYSEKIILTGGLGTYAPSEAQAAFEFATQKLEVDPAVFILEDSSTSTEENARFAKENNPDLENVLIVSDAYHVFRAERVFGKYFAEVDGAGRVPAYNVRIPGGLREVLAIGFYLLQGKI